MNCERAKSELPLLLYGELSFEDEERLQSHLDGCEACRLELESQKSLFALLDDQEAEISPQLLQQCRTRLEEKITALPPARLSWRDHLANWIGSPSRILRPAGAWAIIAPVVLVGVGFLAGRSIPHATAHSDVVAGNNRLRVPILGVEPQAHPVSMRVREVQSGSDGLLQITVDETRQRIISGSANDTAIRRLLVAATTDPNDPGLRGETVGILTNVSPSDDVRQALLYALGNDTNDGVRLRAMDGLKPYARIPEVRRAFVRSLLHDVNAGVRTQAIDVLTQTRPESGAEMPVVGACQELMVRESNSYVRMQCQKRLRELRASEEIY